MEKLASSGEDLDGRNVGGEGVAQVIHKMAKEDSTERSGYDGYMDDVDRTMGNLEVV